MDDRALTWWRLLFGLTGASYCLFRYALAKRAPVRAVEAD